MFKFKIDKKEIEQLCEILKKNDLTEIEIKNGSRSIKISKSNNQNTVISTIQDNTKDEKSVKIKENDKDKSYNAENTIKAPMLGTLYHASSPNAKPFVKKGSKVKVGDIIFIIEAMKTMNQVKSDRNGVVKNILVENGMPVEFDQDLIVIE